jgi:5'-nucleotidase
MERGLLPLGVAVLIVSVLSASCGRTQEQLAVAESDTETNAGPPRILVTNDDGYTTEGIATMAEALAEFADVLVVAPRENVSGSSQSVSVFRPDPIRAFRISIGERLTGYAIHGTPADCVFVGTKIFGKERPFDLVVSGINPAANTGTAYYYSGTVGAAFDGLSKGIPAIAVSQDSQRAEFTTAADFAAQVARRVLAQPLDEGVLLSINVPDGEITCVTTAPPGDFPIDIEFRPISETDGDTVYKSSWVDTAKPKPGDDVWAFNDGCITVTPLQLDRTHHPTLETITEWEPALESFLN